MVEVQNMVSNMGSAKNAVAHQPAVIWYLVSDTKGAIQIESGSN
jgi:hypothetical protein